MATGYQLTPEEQRNLREAEAAGEVSARDLAAIRSGRAAQTFNQSIANQGVRASAAKGSGRGDAAFAATDPRRLDLAPPKANAVAIKKSKIAVAGLIDSLNAAEQKLVTGPDAPFLVANVYKIRFEPAALGDSKVTKEGKPNKAKVPMQQSINPADNVNPETNSVSYDVRTFDYSAGTPIVVILDQILQNSSYIADQAAYIVNETNQKTTPQKPLGELAWYKISVATSRIKYDEKRRDYAYNITYIISAYAINSMLSQYFPAVPLRGIHKSYKYWFTGQNTQVVRFEQKFNSAYTLTFTNATVPSDQRALYQQLGREAPKIEYQAAVGSGSSQGAKGTTNSIGASAADYLYSPTDIAKVELTIVGDPAWLQQGESGAGLSSLGFDFNPFNADGGINFDSQEIIFDLQWNTVADYDVNGTGLANPNKTPATSQASQTYIYRASELTSKFNKGKFEQDLKGTLFEIADARRDTPASGSLSAGDFARQDRAAPATQAVAGGDQPRQNQTLPETPSTSLSALRGSQLTASEQAALTTGLPTTELGGLQLLAPAVNLPPTLTLGGLASNADSFVKSLQDPNAPPYTGDDPIVRQRLGLPPLPATPGATQLIVRDC